VEVDNISLVNLLKSLDGCRLPIARIWHEIQDLGKTFLCPNFLFVRQEANTVAHCCARMASSSEPFHSWFDQAPEWLRELARV
jgi:hypothetical protein